MAARLLSSNSGAFACLRIRHSTRLASIAWPHVTLKKTSYPAIAADAIGLVDAVLLSHDQHSDNLDNSGRAFLAKVARVLTTAAGAKRLGGRTEGLAPWETRALAKPNGSSLQVTATPARHGPAGIEQILLPRRGDQLSWRVASVQRRQRHDARFRFNLSK